MINIEWTNKLHDLYRLLWFLAPIVWAFAMGYLLCYYLNEQKPISCNCNHNVTCSLDSLPPVIIKCNQPKTWA